MSLLVLLIAISCLAIKESPRSPQARLWVTIMITMVALCLFTSLISFLHLIEFANWFIEYSEQQGHHWLFIPAMFNAGVTYCVQYIGVLLIIHSGILVHKKEEKLK